jgi:peptidoglycan/xylan/chitin deacetylase (PgdA/CDA1 family)
VRVPVTLTFDDGLDAHLDCAIPTLDRHGLKGTFFVPLASESFGRRHPEWARAAARGHEIGNHTIFHPAVSQKTWVTEGIAIERYSIDRMRRELSVANTVLGMLDGRTERTFAFPCSNPHLGRPGWPRRVLTRAHLDRTRLMGWIDRAGLDIGSHLVDYTPLVREAFVGARCGARTVASLSPTRDDPHRVRGVEGDGHDGADLVAAVEAAVARKAWLVLVFHGIGDGHDLSCSQAAFADLAGHLASNPRVEVVPFIDGVRRADA